MFPCRVRCTVCLTHTLTHGYIHTCIHAYNQNQAHTSHAVWADRPTHRVLTHRRRTFSCEEESHRKTEIETKATCVTVSCLGALRNRRRFITVVQVQCRPALRNQRSGPGWLSCAGPKIIAVYYKGFSVVLATEPPRFLYFLFKSPADFLQRSSVL